MLTIITNPAQLATAQSQFTQKLQAGLPEKITCTIAAISGGFEAQAACSMESDI